MPPKTRIISALEAHQRTLAAIVSVLLFASVFVVVRDGLKTSDRRTADPGSLANPLATGNPTAKGGASKLSTPSARAQALATATARRQLIKSGSKGGQYVPGIGTIPHGIKGNEITLVYYWKGDQTKSSPYLAGTGQEGNVDEGESFRKLIAYINKYADGGEFMGFKYNLHGFRFKAEVIEAGKGDDQQKAARKIATEIKPMAAISSHGSISAYVCPNVLAPAKIINLSTYDLNWGLMERTNGYCMPAGLSWDAQVDLAIPYLAAQYEDTTYTGGLSPEKRVYGLLYAEYPGLTESAPKVAAMLRKKGLPVFVASVSDDLTTAGRQQAGVVKYFRDNNVNTIIAPDSGSLITFTHAAQALTYKPDYFVWPCSGEDSTGMVRLYNAEQWKRASGLTCYDKELNADLTNDDAARRTEWYKAYQEMAPGHEPPAPTSLVYQSLLPLVVGITHAGQDLTIERFREGLARFTPYRYDAIRGRTNDPGNILVTLNALDGSQVGDAGKVYWDPNTKTPGNATPGVYAFPEPNRRYRRGAIF